MPLRNHFRPPLSDRRSWEELHGGWPMMIVAALGARLPARYVAGPQVHLGSSIEVDVATFEEDEANPATVGERDSDEYEVRVYDTRRGRKLVAAVELVSPANKDRPEHRRAFIAKCLALLQARVCVAIVDLVTTRSANLHADLMESISRVDPLPVDDLYAASYRYRKNGESQVETWASTLELGQPLPTLPLWVAPDFAVPLDLELSYEETCRVLRIP